MKTLIGIALAFSAGAAAAATATEHYADTVAAEAQTNAMAYADERIAETVTELDVDGRIANATNGIPESVQSVGATAATAYSTANAAVNALSGKQDVLTAGENITIVGNVISATGGGGVVVETDPVYSEDKPLLCTLEAAQGMTNGVWNAMPSWVKTAYPQEDSAFSNAVLAVGLNIDTNSVAVLNEIASAFGGFPVEGTATTVGGLLAALAAAVAWLRRNKVPTTRTVNDKPLTDDVSLDADDVGARPADDEIPMSDVTGLADALSAKRGMTDRDFEKEEFHSWKVENSTAPQLVLNGTYEPDGSGMYVVSGHPSAQCHIKKGADNKWHYYAMGVQYGTWDDLYSGTVISTSLTFSIQPISEQVADTLALLSEVPAAVNLVIAEKCASLDPENSTIYDLITALKAI